MEILSQTNPPNAQTSAPQAASGSEADALSSDFETFLLMLTTQMQNQDPLNPIESQDFAVQLATFSGVEQQVRTNELLENLAGGVGQSGLSELAGWVGKEARISGTVAFEGEPITLSFQPEPGADASVLVVRNAIGQIVAQEQVSPGVDTMDWVGVGSNGRPLPSGNYTLELESVTADEVTGKSAVSHYAEISEVRIGATGTEVVLGGGRIEPSSAVTALRLQGQE